MSRLVLDLRKAAAPYKLSLEAPSHLLASARSTWLGRMINEHGSSHVFESVADQLSDAGCPIAEVEACRAFADEERHHGVLCGAVLESLGGEAIAEIDAPLAVPRHEEVDRIEAVLRNLLSVSCLSETVAVSLIAAERVEMPRGPLHDLLTQIWSDEIGHARFGWRIVREQTPYLSPAARDRLHDYLVVALAHVERHEMAHLPLTSPPREGARLGLCNGADARTLFYETITMVILPRLDSLGLRGTAAWDKTRRQSLHAA